MILLMPQLGERLVAHAGERGRVLHRADADDRALARHQPRHRVHGADAARVGQRDRGAGVVVHGQLVAPGPPHDVLVRLPELPEVHRVGGLDARHDQRARAVRLGQVDRDAEVDVLRDHQVAGLPSTSAKELFISGCVAQRPDHRVADEVGEADLAAAAAGEVVVDHDAVVGEQLRRDRAHAGRGRHGQARRPCWRRSARRRPAAAAPAGRRTWAASRCRPSAPRRARSSPRCRSPRCRRRAARRAGLAGAGRDRCWSRACWSRACWSRACWPACCWRRAAAECWWPACRPRECWWPACRPRACWWPAWLWWAGWGWSGLAVGRHRGAAVALASLSAAVAGAAAPLPPSGSTVRWSSVGRDGPPLSGE